MTTDIKQRAYPFSTAKSIGRFDNFDNAKVSKRGTYLKGIDDLIGPYGKYPNSRVIMPGIGVIKNFKAGNYTLSDGSTGAAAVNSPAGLVLDGAGSVGSELVDQSLFAAGDAGSLVAANASTVTVTNNDPTAAFTTALGGPLVVGATYLVSYTLVTAPAGSPGRILVGGYDSGSTITVGAYQRYVVASATTGIFVTNGSDAVNGHSSVWSGISVRQVSGIHATASGAARPRLDRGARNLLKYSQDLTQAGAWTKGGVTSTATALTEDGTTGPHRISQTLTTTAGPATVSMTIQNVSGARLIDIAPDGTLATAGTYGAFNPVTGALAFSNGILSSTSVPDGAGWRVSITFTALAGTGGLYFEMRTAANATSYAGDSTSSVSVSKIQLEIGSTASDYSPTTTAAASNPNAGRYSFGFDGAQSFAFGSVPFQMADDLCVIGSVNTDATGTRTIFAQASTATANPLIELDVSAGLPRFAFRDDAGLSSTPGSAVSIANTTSVVSGRKLGNNKEVRVNGIQKAVDTAVLGATTFNSAAIGVRPIAAPANFISGSIGPVILIKGTVSDADLLTLERFVASLTPNGPIF